MFVEAIGGATIVGVGGALGGGVAGAGAGYALEECTGTVDRDYILKGGKYGAMAGGYIGMVFGSKWATENYVADTNAHLLLGKPDL